MDNYYKVLRFEHIDILLKHIKPSNWRKVLPESYNAIKAIFIKYGYLVIQDHYDKEHYLFWNSRTNFSNIAEEELIIFNPGFNTDIIDKIENILNEIENGKK